MKSLRRSLGDKEKDKQGNMAPPPIPGMSKPNGSNPHITPPKKVIRARENHKSSSPLELAFTKGDFFYVVGEKVDSKGKGWYEALNTITNARGIVPKDKFEEFGRGGTAPVSSGTTSPVGSMPKSSGGSVTPVGGKPAPLYAIVQYDFVAERPDELDATAGEPIIVIAQSNHEWFVAKPIGRLGGPGLIPVSFVEIRDPLTGKAVENVSEILRAGGVPLVDEWKKKTADYQSSAISLGRFDFKGAGPVVDSPFTQPGGPPQGQQFQSHPQQQQYYSNDQRTSSGSGQGGAYNQQQQRGPINSGGLPHSTSNSSIPSFSNTPSNAGHPPQSATSYDSSQILPPGTFTAASVVSFHFEDNQYWFRLHVTYIPMVKTSPAMKLILFRIYDDFYHFQISLLDEFPVEAGRNEDGSNRNSQASPSLSSPERILPYMPGPLEEVDDIVTEGRREDLDMYLGELIGLHQNAPYILSHKLMRKFFTPFGGDHQSEFSRAEAEAEFKGKMDELAREMRALDMQSNQQPPPPPPQGYRLSAVDTAPGSSVRHSTGYSNRGHSPVPPPPIDTSSARSHQPQYTPTSGSSRPESNSNGYHPSSASPSVPMTNQSWGSQQPHHQHSNSGDRQQGPVSSFSPVTPNMSQSGGLPASSYSNQPVPQQQPPSAAYKKIKIFDRSTDDLIALRVPPSVTFDQLMEKVRDRLGQRIQRLQFRVSQTAGYRNITGDRDLEQWMYAGGTGPLVLYAE